MKNSGIWKHKLVMYREEDRVVQVQVIILMEEMLFGETVNIDASVFYSYDVYRLLPYAISDVSLN